MSLEMVLAYDRPEEIRALFSEYTAMLVENDPAFKAYLAIQRYDEDVLHPEKKYGWPDGRLYAALWDGQPVGCIGLKKIDGQCCELKRLYVRPAFRHRHIARQLVERVINDAKTIGYDCIRLDTLPFLQDAIRLYKAYGFYEIPRYNDSPMDTSIYMKLDL